MRSLVPQPATLARPEGPRRYLVAAPPGATPCGRALIIVLHGAGASAEQVLGLAFPPSPLSVWLDIAAREQLVVIAPDAGKGGWSDCFASETRVANKDDVAFIDALIDHAIARHDVDPARVYLLPDRRVVRLPASDPRARTSVTRFMWGRAPDGLQVGLYRIEGAGHAEPSRLKRYPRFINWLTGLQSGDLEVAEAAWDFFREKRKQESPHHAGFVTA